MPTDEITIDDLVNWYCEEKGIVLWKDIPGYEGHYQVSNIGGMVRNKQSGKYLANHTTTGGYIQMNLRKNGKRSNPLLHRLVAETWVPNPYNLPEVNHIDEVKTSNNAANLEWCDRNYNANYGTLKERLAIAPIEQYTKDNVLIDIYVSIGEASRKTSINNRHICEVCNGKRKTAGGYIWKYKK